MKLKSKRLFLKLFLLIVFCSTIGHAQFDGNYIFQLELATQMDINAITIPQKGMMIYNTTDNKLYYYNGTQWINLDKTIISTDSDNALNTGTDGGAYFPKAKVLVKSTNYTLTSNDNRAILTFDSATDVTLTIPTGLPIGYNVSVYQINTGKVTISSSAGVSVKNRLSRFKTAGKDAGIGIVSTATDIFHVTGDLKK